jgi:IS66 C-terminal element/Transposase IS66 family
VLDRVHALLDDGRICLSNNAAERGVRGIALGRKSWLFCGSDRGGERAAVMYSLIVTAKMNDIDPQAWLADVLARIAEHPVQKIDELLPWNWRRLDLRTVRRLDATRATPPRPSPDANTENDRLELLIEGSKILARAPKPGPPPSSGIVRSTSVVAVDGLPSPV